MTRLIAMLVAACFALPSFAQGASAPADPGTKKAKKDQKKADKQAKKNAKKADKDAKKNEKKAEKDAAK